MIKDQDRIMHFPYSPRMAIGVLALEFLLGGIQANTLVPAARAAELFAILASITYLGLYAAYLESEAKSNQLIVKTSWFCAITSIVFQVYSLTVAMISYCR